MDKIRISNIDKTMSIVMPKVKDITVGAEEVSKTLTMASGRIVKDLIGYRNIINASWDYVPAATIVSLLDLLKKGNFFYVEYPSPSGDAVGVFEIDYPTLSIFAYLNNVAVWHNVTLKMKAQEVI